jgi:hypothetical protein
VEIRSLGCADCQRDCFGGQSGAVDRDGGGELRAGIVRALRRTIVAAFQE